MAVAGFSASVLLEGAAIAAKLQRSDKVDGKPDEVTEAYNAGVANTVEVLLVQASILRAVGR